jgi:hypothetical protein
MGAARALPAAADSDVFSTSFESVGIVERDMNVPYRGFSFSETQIDLLF